MSNESFRRRLSSRRQRQSCLWSILRGVGICDGVVGSCNTNLRTNIEIRFGGVVENYSIISKGVRWDDLWARIEIWFIEVVRNTVDARTIEDNRIIMDCLAAEMRCIS